MVDGTCFTSPKVEFASTVPLPSELGMSVDFFGNEVTWEIDDSRHRLGLNCRVGRISFSLKDEILDLSS